jgi:hypothetical protein
MWWPGLAKMEPCATRAAFIPCGVRAGGVHAAATFEMSELFLRINARCNLRNVIPLAYRSLRNEDVADGLLCWRPADRASVNKTQGGGRGDERGASHYI